jgi:hypothetical protein
VENVIEYVVLNELGIKAKVVPSFMGDVKKFKVSYKQNDRPKLYSSVSGNNFDVYGWDKIDKLAEERPDIDFYLYGNTADWESKNPNVYVRGRVLKEVMNNEIKDMQGAIRMTTFDGASEIIVKSILMGQYPVSPFIDYPYVLNKVDDIKYMYKPNIEGREWWLKNLNQYQWNSKN